MKERTLVVHECEICGLTGTNKAEIERCEAQGFPPIIIVGKEGFIYRFEVDNQGDFQQLIEWVEQIRVTSVTRVGHRTRCNIERIGFYNPMGYPELNEVDSTSILDTFEQAKARCQGYGYSYNRSY